MLYIDRQYKYGLEELAIVILYGLIHYYFNGMVSLKSDIYNVISAYIISMIIGRIVLGLRSRQGLAMVELRRYSSLDKLTKVYNKAALLQEIDTSMYMRSEEDGSCAMSIIDVDDFKHINDNLGHGGGDLVLEHLGDLLLKSFRPSDIIGRFGGDEFIVFMPDMKDASLIEFRCRSLQMQLTDFHIGNNKPFSLSIGTIIDYGKHSREELFSMADDALYKSKLMGKNCCTSWICKEDRSITKPFMMLISSEEADRIDEIMENEDSRFEVVRMPFDNEAIQFISQYRNSVAVIIVGTDKDKENGWFTLRYIKTRERFRSIPVLAVVSSEEEKENAYKEGADVVLFSSDGRELYRQKIKELTGR